MPTTCSLVPRVPRSGQATFATSTPSPPQRHSTHHDRRGGHALQVEDIHAGLCAARLLISPLARLGKVKVGAVGLPGRGDGAVSPSVSGPRPLQGPPSPAPRESSVQVPGSLSSPSLCLLPSCARLSRAGVTLCPQEKAQGSSSPACPPARPEAALRKHSQRAPEVLECGPLVSGGGLGHLPHTRP